MGDKVSNKATITGDGNAVVQSGKNSGSISVSARAAVGSTREVSALLAELRTQVAATDVDKRAVIEDNLDDLVEDIRKAQDPKTSNEVPPAVTLNRWEKIKSLLGGLSQFTELVAKISDHVQRIFGGN